MPPAPAQTVPPLRPRSPARPRSPEQTVLDLEDRFFSDEWKKRRDEGTLPIERRPLTNPGNANTQGYLKVKVEILERKLALADPMIPIEPPKLDMFELRVVVWDAFDVKAKDENFFGAGGTSDVMVTCRLYGQQPYPMYKTDIHGRSPGDAEFNWRMVWPMALPETSPRLFLQVWDTDTFSADDAIGEAQLTLKPLCDKAFKTKASVKYENIPVQVTHPNFDGPQGTVRITLELIPRGEALQRPVGQGRSKPNQHPFLPEPVRAAPWRLPWASAPPPR